MNSLPMAVLVVGIYSISALAEPPPALKLVQSIELPGVEGRMDHLAVDVEGRRLFVTGLGNDTVEVIDLAAGKRIKQLAGLKEPQGVAYLPDFKRLVVTNGEGASAIVYDAKSLELVATIVLAADPDNVRYDAAAKRVYVGHGSGGSSAIGAIDPAKNVRLSDIKLAGHPESFQLEGDGPRIFVNVPAAGHVAVVDRKKGAVTAVWPLKEAASNFPMALDEKHQRLFVGCRRPAKLLVLDTASGKTVSTLDCVSDTDDVFYDAAASRIYVSGGGGAVSIFQQADADHYRLIGEEATASGARTSLFVPQLESLYVAVPHRGSQRAEIRVFAIGR